MKEMVSCMINILTGGSSNQMFCTRVYILSMESEGWEVTRIILDTLFSLKEERHCRACYLYHQQKELRYVSKE